MCDHTAKLPPELRRMVCEQLPRESLKRVRLVSQSWGHVAAALLWHTFTSDLSDTSTREFDALLTSNPGGFLDSVRVLNIRGEDDLKTNGSRARLLLLLCLLPRGLLRKFTAQHTIERQTLGVLLKRHPRLYELSFQLSSNTAVRGPPNGRYVEGNLMHLNTLVIRATTDQEGFDAWFPHAPDLGSLTVSGILRGLPCCFQPWCAESKLKKLRSLYLNNLIFTASAGELDAWLDLDRLESVTIRNCENAEIFIADLAECYTAHGLSALKTFSIYGEIFDCDWIEELETFLAAVRGLEYLYVSAAISQRLDPDSICFQASSLRYLVVEYLNSWDQEEEDADCMYDATELEVLSKACSRIEELGLSCAQIDFTEWPILEPFTWHPAAARTPQEKELIKFLDVISTFQSLRVLRMTQSALDVMDGAATGNEFLERQWRYQQFAEQILKYLVHCHSSIELLAFSPTRVIRDYSGTTPDGNDHKYPHYYYLRGESETVLPQGHSKKQIVAVPIKPSEISKYMEEPKALVDPETV